MEAKFRPLPLSIIDFFGVVVPGFVWLVLFITAGLMTGSAGRLTPIDGWNAMARVVERSGTWLGPLAVVLISAVIGYSMKPRAMKIATMLAAPMMKVLQRERFRGVARRDITFPFHRLHAGTSCYEELTRRVAGLTSCDAASLPPHQPFSSAKRLLRLIAPSLWEELEHREAEVRLLGMAFLASVFSLALSLTELVREWPHVATGAIVWLLASLAAAVFLGDGFGYMRVGEVDYTYLHTLLALNAREQGLIGPKAGGEGGEEDE